METAEAVLTSIESEDVGDPGVLGPRGRQKRKMKDAAKRAKEYENAMASGTFEKRMEALSDPSMGGEGDGKISVAFSPERLRLLLRAASSSPFWPQGGSPDAPVEGGPRQGH